MRLSYLLAILTLLSAGPASATPWDDGWDAYARRDYTTALKHWRPLAEAGNAPAQFNLGVMYDDGLGVPTDYAQAAKWYRLAADRGHAKAQHTLGIMYDHGHGVPVDYVQAVKWFRLAAYQGEAQAQLRLGFMYSAGRGLPKDDVMAYRWLNISAAGGETSAGGLRDRLASGMSRDQIAAAQKMSLEWKPK
jgi:TPR repeat protein